MRGILMIVALCLLCASCTERRRMTAPEPDGDTIEVVIQDRSQELSQPVRRVIEVASSDSSDVTDQSEHTL